MEITRALPVGNHIQPHDRSRADALREPPAFKRSTAVDSSFDQATAGRATRAGAMPAVAKDRSLAHRVGDVYLGCEKLGMQPGQSKEITVGGQPMILRRTQSGDAYVWQKADDAINAPFNGLHISKESVAKLNMEALSPQHPAYLEGLRQLVALGNALKVEPSDWHGFNFGP